MQFMTMSVQPSRSTGGFCARWSAAALVAAVVPAPFLVALLVSLGLRRPLLGSVARSAGRSDPEVATRLTVWWAVGMFIATAGQAVGAAVGVMNIFKLSGLAVHCAFGLVVVALLAAASFLSIRRA